jgi:hypothetical protein
LSFQGWGLLVEEDPNPPLTPFEHDKCKAVLKELNAEEADVL